MLLLTYLAQVRQLHYKNAVLPALPVSTMRHILPIRTRQKRGTSHRAIATIGIVHAVVWDEQNKNMDVWSRDVANWQKNMTYISSQSLVEGRK